MKTRIIEKLECFKASLTSIRKAVRQSETEMINRRAIRSQAECIATLWIQELSGSLKQFNLPEEDLASMDKGMKRLLRISQQGNRKTSYTEILDVAYHRFNARFIVPIKQSSPQDTLRDLRSMLPESLSNKESEYMQEAFGCADAGYFRAAIVMGWCAAIDKLQTQIDKFGFDKFNRASEEMKRKTTGKYKSWNKIFSISTAGELQGISDADLITLLEYLEFFDSNQANRLRTSCLQYRNQSAHPGNAPIGKDHVKIFFSDIGKIVFDNPKMKR